MKYVLKYCYCFISLESPFYVDYNDVLFESVGIEVKELRNKACVIMFVAE